MIIKAKNIVLSDQMIEDGAIMIKGDKIEKIYKKGDPIEANEEVKDYGQATISPGFVDTHIHGFSGCDIMDKSSQSVKVICKDILSIGVTSFLPTTLTASVDDLNEVVKIVGDCRDSYGAKIQGIFLEGPFFTDKYKGAQNNEYFSKPSIEKLKKWQELSGNLIKKIAIAPELEGAEDFIREARKIGVYVGLGHSDATFEEAKRSVDAGANIFVHTYNGMSGLHHRNPGMVGAALTLEDVFAEMICDGHHVHPAAANVVVKARGCDSVMLVSDCMMAGGMPPGQYKLGDFNVTMDGKTARLEAGNLAGSVLSMKEAVKNVISWGIASPLEAIHMATLVPAKSVGIDDVCGVIDEGRVADLVILDDKYEIIDVYLDGKKVII